MPDPNSVPLFRCKSCFAALACAREAAGDRCGHHLHIARCPTLHGVVFNFFPRVLLLGIRSPAMRWSINCAHARRRRGPLWAASCIRTGKVTSAGSGSGLVGRVLRSMGLVGPSPISERPILAATHSEGCVEC